MDAAGRDRRHRHGLWKCFFLENQWRAEKSAAPPAEGRVISAEEGSDGVVRVKIVMSKRELNRMMSGHRRLRASSTLAPPPQQSLEQLLHALRRRRTKRAESRNRRGGWMPALQSIPEEN